MKNTTNAGFTLIELLVVIGIIAILAGLIGVAAPRALERARITDVENDFTQLRTALSVYYADTGSYPPGYGYRRIELDNRTLAGESINPFAIPYDKTYSDSQLFYLGNYMEQIGQFKAFDLYDRFNNNSHDASGNGGIEYLEYQPVGKEDLVNPGQYTGFSGNRYDTNNNSGEAQRMLGEQGPYIYIPVDSTQAKRYRQYCLAGWQATGNIDYANAQVFDFSDSTIVDGRAIGERYLANLSFPPPKYDAFVLVSVGPVQNVNGILPTPLSGQYPEDILDAYHILGLRAYFLATRDINNNGKLDFDFRARTRQNENSTAFDNTDLGKLPDGTGAQGPMIFVQAK
jgi:prepilin-type N-terminal cleavage/methylation domain-containing protein